MAATDGFPCTACGAHAKGQGKVCLVFRCMIGGITVFDIIRKENKREMLSMNGHEHLYYRLGFYPLLCKLHGIS